MGTPETVLLRAKSGGANRDRTDDLYNAIVALSQLSCSPTDTRNRPGSFASTVPLGRHGSASDATEPQIVTSISFRGKPQALRRRLCSSPAATRYRPPYRD